MACPPRGNKLPSSSFVKKLFFAEKVSSSRPVAFPLCDNGNAKLWTLFPPTPRHKTGVWLFFANKVSPPPPFLVPKNRRHCPSDHVYVSPFFRQTSVFCSPGLRRPLSPLIKKTTPPFSAVTSSLFLFQRGRCAFFPFFLGSGITPRCEPLFVSQWSPPLFSGLLANLLSSAVTACDAF